MGVKAISISCKDDIDCVLVCSERLSEIARIPEMYSPDVSTTPTYAKSSPSHHREHVRTDLPSGGVIFEEIPSEADKLVRTVVEDVLRFLFDSWRSYLLGNSNSPSLISKTLLGHPVLEEYPELREDAVKELKRELAILSN